MESKIRVEFDFDTNEPIIEITKSSNKDDMRDQMLSAFIEKANANDKGIILSYPSFNPDNRKVQLRVAVKFAVLESDLLDENHIMINAEYLKDFGQDLGMGDIPYVKGESYNLLFNVGNNNTILIKDAGYVAIENGFRKYTNLYNFLEYWKVNQPTMVK
jgi:hypothetical protein